MLRFLGTVTQVVVGSNGWEKFSNPTVACGGTVWPRSPAEQRRLGVRYDYDGDEEIDGIVYHRFKMQPNAGRIPSCIKHWRSKSARGTHSVMAEVLVPRGAGKAEVEAALDRAHRGVRGV